MPHPSPSLQNDCRRSALSSHSPCSACTSSLPLSQRCGSGMINRLAELPCSTVFPGSPLCTALRRQKPPRFSSTRQSKQSKAPVRSCPHMRPTVPALVRRPSSRERGRRNVAAAASLDDRGGGAIRPASSSPSVCCPNSCRVVVLRQTTVSGCALASPGSPFLRRRLAAAAGRPLVLPLHTHKRQPREAANAHTGHTRRKHRKGEITGKATQETKTHVASASAGQ